MNYVKTCVIILISAMVLSLVLTYASIMTIIQFTKSNAERVLTSYCIENSTKIYSSIKNGNDFTQFIDTDYFTDVFIKNGGTLDFDGIYLYNRNKNGSYVYRLTIPQIAFTNENTLSLTCTFDLLIPVEFAGKQFTELRILIKVKVNFNLIN